MHIDDIPRQRLVDLKLVPVLGVLVIAIDVVASFALDVTAEHKHFTLVLNSRVPIMSDGVGKNLEFPLLLAFQMVTGNDIGDIMGRFCI